MMTVPTAAADRARVDPVTLEIVPAGQFWPERGSENSKHHLRQEKRAIARAVEPESLRAGEDRAGRGERHQSETL